MIKIEIRKFIFLAWELLEMAISHYSGMVRVSENMIGLEFTSQIRQEMMTISPTMCSQEIGSGQAKVSATMI